MPWIRSANPDAQPIQSGDAPSYTHGLNSRKTFIPMAFQVTSPLDPMQAMLPHALVLHVNPSTYSESHTKKTEVIQTRGGFVEQHWGDELVSISADGSTGAFMNIYTGLSSVMRQRTIAWDRFRDLYELFKNNGSVHDPFGNIVLQGSILLMYDRGMYSGTFRQFDMDEADDQPFAFKVSWTFKVEHTLLQVPLPLFDTGVETPAFQAQNVFTQSTIASEGLPPSTAEQSRMRDQVNSINQRLAETARTQKAQLDAPGGQAVVDAGELD